MTLLFGSLFTGIGGLDLGLERAGMMCAWQVEIDPAARRVLEHHWPDVPRHGDIRKLKGDELEPVDLLCGGFPCQPVSVAGKRKGQSDGRWLWPEFARLVRLLRPRYVLVENVPGLLTANGGRAFGEVIGDLAACGYGYEWDCIPAAAVGAPHLRYRVFIVAHAEGERTGRVPAGQRRSEQTPSHVDGRGAAMADPRRIEGGERPQTDKVGRRAATRQQAGLGDSGWRAGAVGVVSDANRSGLEGAGIFGPTPDRTAWDTEPDVRRVVDGVPGGMDRLRLLGNAVVPQVAEWLGRRILATAGAVSA